MRLDATSRTQTVLKAAYAGHILAWFCFLFLVHTLNPPHREFSTLVLIVLFVAALAAIVVGFVIRKKTFAQSTEAFPRDPRQSLRLCRAANLIGFSCALSVAVYGVALKRLGSSWLVSGTLFAVSLGFLLLWKPRPLA